MTPKLPNREELPLWVQDELAKWDDSMACADRVASACSAMLISDLKYALYNYHLTFAHIETARILRDAGHMDVPWIHAVANATEESDMEAVCDIACMALEEEGEE